MSHRLRPGLILRAKCPECGEGQVLDGLFGIHKRCSVCDYNFHPEPGYYLGAMMVSFLFTAMVTVPPVIWLKIKDADPVLLFTFPLIEFAVVGSLLIRYSRVLWLHLEHTMTRRLDP